MSLAGRVAVVTGGAHGIGAAIADALAADGAKVHRVDKQPTALDGSALMAADLTDPNAVNDVFTAVGPVDILVNTAGGVVGQVGRPLEEVPVDAWRTVVDANLMTMFLCTRAVVPAMKERGWGRIVNISSGAGLTVSKTGIQAYATAKAGQLGFTRQMAHELGPYGITVNCIAPGFILSNPTTQRQWESYGEAGQRALVEGIAMRRLGEPADIANGVRFFVAEESSWVTGQTISIDGGHALL
jgi:3-oxoacyl-[acyl-carrier protein] reductase